MAALPRTLDKKNPILFVKEMEYSYNNLMNKRNNINMITLLILSDALTVILNFWFL